MSSDWIAAIVDERRREREQAERIAEERAARAAEVAGADPRRFLASLEAALQTTINEYNRQVDAARHMSITRADRVLTIFLAGNELARFDIDGGDLVVTYLGIPVRRLRVVLAVGDGEVISAFAPEELAREILEPMIRRVA